MHQTPPYRDTRAGICITLNADAIRLYCKTELRKERRLNRRRRPLFRFAHGFINLVEAFYGEQAFLQLVHLYRRGQDLVETEIPDLAAFLDHVAALAM